MKTLRERLARGTCQDAKNMLDAALMRSKEDLTALTPSALRTMQAKAVLTCT